MKPTHFLYLPVILLGSLSLTSCLDDDNGGDTDITPGYISFVNAFADTTGLDFYVGSSMLGQNELNYTDRFPQDSYIDAVPYQYVLTVTYPNSTNELDQWQFSINQDRYHSIYVYNTHEEVRAMMVEDNLTSPSAGNAKVRFLHLGSGIARMDLGIAGEDALFSDLEFGKSSQDYVEVPGGVIEFEARSSNDESVLATESMALENGKVYTIWVRGISTETDGKALGLELNEHEEFVNPATP